MTKKMKERSENYYVGYAMSTWFWLGYSVFFVSIVVLAVIDLESDSGCLKGNN